MVQIERKGILVFLILVLLALGLTAFPGAAVPQTAGEWYNEGVNYTNQGRYDGAIYAFDQAITLDPGYAKAYFAKGQVLATIGRHNDALGAYETAIALDPELSGVVENYLITSEKVVYPDIPSGSLITGYWVSGWGYLTINNQQGAFDVVVALAPIGTDAATIAVYVKKGYYHTLEGIVPPGSYDVYITYGERWNVQEKRFEKNAGYLRWAPPQYSYGALGSGYSMTFITAGYYPSWFIYNIDPIPEAQFPTLS